VKKHLLKAAPYTGCLAYQLSLTHTHIGTFKQHFYNVPPRNVILWKVKNGQNSTKNVPSACCGGGDGNTTSLSLFFRIMKATRRSSTLVWSKLHQVFTFNMYNSHEMNEEHRPLRGHLKINPRHKLPLLQYVRQSLLTEVRDCTALLMETRMHSEIRTSFHPHLKSLKICKYCATREMRNMQYNVNAMYWQDM
jgi:hypothetical protein